MKLYTMTIALRDRTWSLFSWSCKAQQHAILLLGCVGVWALCMFKNIRKKKSTGIPVRKEGAEYNYLTEKGTNIL
jgi:hypothetical protein